LWDKADAVLGLALFDAYKTAAVDKLNIGHTYLFYFTIPHARRV
jgi:hypothetical protein